ncbi:hypothetical protein CVT26_000937, partial [Gymnopilus dilepis]
MQSNHESLVAEEPTVAKAIPRKRGRKNDVSANEDEIEQEKKHTSRPVQQTTIPHNGRRPRRPQQFHPAKNYQIAQGVNIKPVPKIT